MELRLLWDIFRTRLWLLILVVGSALVLALAIIKFSPTVYQGTATLQVKRISETATFLSILPTASAELNYIDKDNVMGSVDVFLRNDKFIKQVMDACGITSNEFTRAPSKFSDPGMVSILSRKLGVQIEAEKDSEIFTITGMSTNLDQAQNIANTFSREFMAYYQEIKRIELRRMREAFAARLALLDAEVDEVEKKEMEFRIEHRLMDFDSQQSALLNQLKTCEDDIADDLNTIAKASTEKTESHPDVMALRASIARHEQRKEEVEQQLAKILELEVARADIVKHRSNLDTANASVDSAMRIIDAALDLDMSHFLVLNPAIVAGDADDYVYMPNKGLILVIFFVLGVMGAIILVFLVEYANEAPRLFSSFERAVGNTRAISVRGSRGWTLVLAELARLKPGARVAIVQRGGRRSHGFPRRLSRTGGRCGQKLEWVEVSTGGRTNGSDRSVEPGAALASTLAAPATGPTPALYSFPTLAQSPAAYLQAPSFDFVIYVALSGRANIEDIRADIRYLNAHGMADRTLGVFYDS